MSAHSAIWVIMIKRLNSSTFSHLHQHIWPYIYHRYINIRGKGKRKHLDPWKENRTQMYVVRPNLGVTSTKRVSHLVTLDSFKSYNPQYHNCCKLSSLRAFTNTFIRSYKSATSRLLQISFYHSCRLSFLKVSLSHSWWAWSINLCNSNGSTKNRLMYNQVCSWL